MTYERRENDAPHYNRFLETIIKFKTYLFCLRS